MGQDNASMKEQLISKVERIIENEKFRLDAYFLCGAAAQPPNANLQKACEAYLEAEKNGQPDEAVTAAMVAELEAVLSTAPKIKVRGDMTDNRKTLQEVLDNREYL